MIWNQQEPKPTVPMPREVTEALANRASQLIRSDFFLNRHGRAFGGWRWSATNRTMWQSSWASPWRLHGNAVIDQAAFCRDEFGDSVASGRTYTATGVRRSFSTLWFSNSKWCYLRRSVARRLPVIVLRKDSTRVKPSQQSPVASFGRNSGIRHQSAVSRDHKSDNPSELRTVFHGLAPSPSRLTDKPSHTCCGWTFHG